MPADKNPRGKSPQAQLGRKSQSLGSGALTDARRTLLQLAAEREARGKMSKQDLRRHERAVAKAREMEARAQLAEVRKLGLYDPRLKPGEARLELTPARLRRIRAASRVAEGLGKEAVFAPFPRQVAPASLRAIKAEAERQNARVTKRGIIVPRSEREMRVATGRLRYDRQLGSWFVEVRKTTETAGERRTITERRFLSGSEALDKMQDRIARKFDPAKFDRRRQRLRFVISGRNVSRRSFRDMAELFKYARGYRTDARAQAAFLDQLTVIVVERDRKKEWRRPVAQLGSRGFVEFDPELAEGYLDEDEDEPEIARPRPKRHRRGKRGE